MTFAEAAFYKDVATVLISILAITLTIYTAYLSRENNRLNHRPLLTYNANNNKNSQSYSIRNVGNGVAIITGHWLYINGKEVTQDEFMEDLLSCPLSFEEKRVQKKINDIECDSTGLYKGSCIGVNEEFIIFRIKSNSNFTEETCSKIRSRFSTKIQYKSLYGQRFEYISNNLKSIEN